MTPALQPRAWALDPALLLALTLATGLALDALRRAWQRGGPEVAVAGRRAGALLAAVLALALAFLSPVAAFRPQLFALDMAQHVVLTMLAPPLLLLGLPLLGEARGAGRLAALGRGVVGRRVAGWLGRARVAFLLYLLVLYLSFASSVYEMALRAEPLHAALHGALFTAALLFWRPVLGPGRRLPPGWALAYLAAAVVAQPKALGGLLTVVSKPLYAYYTEVPRLGGLSTLDDQQLAAGVLGLGSVLALGTGMVANFLAFLTHQDREQAAREAAEEDGWSPVAGRGT